MSRRILTLLTFAATAAATPALAAPAPAQNVSFTRDGQAFTATVTDDHGARFVSGREVATGRTFELRIAHGHVTGTYAGLPVSYDLADIAAKPATIETAAR